VSTWVEDRVYDYCGQKIRCVRRYLEGCLELVDLQLAEQHQASGADIEPVTITRTARTLAPCVVPKVTETLGGVLRAGACDHRHYGRVIANAGPNAAKECCDACGDAIGTVAAPERPEAAP
jgi:hypothetical protein